MTDERSAMAELTERVEADAVRDASSTMYRGISDMSNDSIRHLMKIASMSCPLIPTPSHVVLRSGIEEQLSLDNIDLTDICDSWDVPLGPNFAEGDTMPMDFQMEVDAMRQQIQHQDYPSGEPMKMDYDDLPMSGQMPNPMSYDPVEPPPYGYPTQQSMAPPQDGSHTYSDSGMMQSMEYRVPPEMGVQRPRVNLFLDSNVVMLDPSFCPKPAVTVLPSQVIHAPEPHTSSNTSTRGLHGYGSGALADTDMSWSYPQPQDPYAAPPMYSPQQPLEYEQTHPNSAMTTMNGEFSRMMMNPVDDPFEAVRRARMAQTPGYSEGPVGGLGGELVDESFDGRSGKVVRKNTKGDKLPVETQDFKPEDFMKAAEDNPTQPPSELEAPGIESHSAEIRKIESMTEAEICNYVKSMAPQIQNNAWEEVVKETKFEERLEKAEQKMQEHTIEMARIKTEMAGGRLDPRTGQDMLRKVYNRREAAASRTKREQGLVKAAIKKRTLEKICSWMREHLIGNSDLFRTGSTDEAVRRSRSLGTQYQYRQEAADE